jgi:hypothetical protein
VERNLRVLSLIDIVYEAAVELVKYETFLQQFSEALRANNRCAGSAV